MVRVASRVRHSPWMVLLLHPHRTQRPARPRHLTDPKLAVEAFRARLRRQRVHVELVASAAIHPDLTVWEGAVRRRVLERLEQLRRLRLAPSEFPEVEHSILGEGEGAGEGEGEGGG